MVLYKFQRPTPEQVFADQLARFIDLGYREPLDISEDELISIVSMPEDRPGALLVFPANIIPTTRQIQLIGGDNYLDSSLLKDMVKTPDKPYWIYGILNSGRRSSQLADICKDVDIGELEKIGRRGLITVESISLVAQHPGILSIHPIIILSSRYDESKRLPFLSLLYGRPGLSAYWPDDPLPHLGSASCEI